MRKILLLAAIVSLTGCSTISTIKEYWPRSHDPVMFDHLVNVEINIAKIDCEKPDWQPAVNRAEMLAKYTEWRGDPQRINLKGLHDHTIKMSKGGSKTFCEMGKKTAVGRIDAARKAWEGR